MRPDNSQDHLQGLNLKNERKQTFSEGIHPEISSNDSSNQMVKKGAKIEAKDLSKWTIWQERKYLIYIQKYRSLFDLQLGERKKAKIHCRLSKFIKTKDSLQCRSHHQKMVKKYGDLEAIIEALSTSMVQQNKKRKKALKSQMKAQLCLIDFSSKEMTRQKSLWQQLIFQEPPQPVDCYCI